MTYYDSAQLNYLNFQFRVGANGVLFNTIFGFSTDSQIKAKKFQSEQYSLGVLH